MLAGLPERYRVPLVLVYCEGYHVKEVAFFLDVPLGTMLARLHRGRKLFERRLWTMQGVRTPSGGSTTMITRAEAVRQLWDYLDGIVVESQRESIEEHLSFCCQTKTESRREPSAMAPPSKPTVRRAHPFPCKTATMPASGATSF